MDSYCIFFASRSSSRSAIQRFLLPDVFLQGLDVFLQILEPVPVFFPALAPVGRLGDRARRVSPLADILLGPLEPHLRLLLVAQIGKHLGIDLGDRFEFQIGAKPGALAQITHEEGYRHAGFEILACLVDDELGFCTFAKHDVKVFSPFGSVPSIFCSLVSGTYIAWRAVPAIIIDPWPSMERKHDDR